MERFNKRDNEKKKDQKRKEKQQRKDERKSNAGSKSFDDMIAYVDENGMITNTPPDPTKKQKIDAETIAIATPRKGTEEPEALRGRVEHFRSDKGFGFIKSLTSVDKYFFHISNAPSNIAEGQTVTYELERGERGMSAVRIVIE